MLSETCTFYFSHLLSIAYDIFFFQYGTPLIHLLFRHQVTMDDRQLPGCPQGP